MPQVQPKDWQPRTASVMTRRVSEQVRDADGDSSPIEKPRLLGMKPTPVLQHLPRIADMVLLQTLYVRGYASRRLATSVGVLHVLEAKGSGDLPPILVLHGLSASGQYYENLM